jgi:hypothetical protein
MSDMDVLSDLDFHPGCEVDDPADGGGDPVKCDQPAVWIGTPPCGHEGYFCEAHHHSQHPFKCLVCGRTKMHLATYRWTRLRS